MRILPSLYPSSTDAHPLPLENLVSHFLAVPVGGHQDLGSFGLKVFVAVAPVELGAVEVGEGWVLGKVDGFELAVGVEAEDGAGEVEPKRDAGGDEMEHFIATELGDVLLVLHTE